MFKVMVSFFIVLAFNISAQNDIFLQVGGGLISPVNSTDGYSFDAQAGYDFSDNFGVYASLGFAAWDNNNLIHNERDYPVTGNPMFKTYDEDSHLMIPVSFGGRVKYDFNNWFYPFVEVELGYSNIQYDKYNNLEREFNTINGVKRVTGISPTEDSKEEISENLFTGGFGLGVIYPLNDNFGLVLSYKLNGNIYSDQLDSFSSRRTISRFLLGVNLII